MVGDSWNFLGSVSAAEYAVAGPPSQGKAETVQPGQQKNRRPGTGFPLPHAGIREFDQALQAMDNMRQELSRSLSAQWTAQQERESEIAALTHDLKTPSP